MHNVAARRNICLAMQGQGCRPRYTRKPQQSHRLPVRGHWSGMPDKPRRVNRASATVLTRHGNTCSGAGSRTQCARSMTDFPPDKSSDGQCGANYTELMPPAMGTTCAQYTNGCWPRHSQRAPRTCRPRQAKMQQYSEGRKTSK